MAAFFRAPSNNRENFYEAHPLRPTRPGKARHARRQGHIRDLSKIVPDITGDTLSPESLTKMRKAKVDKLPLVRGTPRIGPCIGKVGNFIAIGLNYSPTTPPKPACRCRRSRSSSTRRRPPSAARTTTR